MNNHQNKNKETVRRLYEEILNTGKLELLSQVIDADYTGVGPTKGAAGFAETVNTIRQGFPDIKWTIEELIAEGDKVVARWAWQGTNKGSFRGFAPTGRVVHDNAIAIYKFKESKIVHASIQSDRLGFLQQIGAISPDVTTPSKIAETSRAKQTLIDKFLVPKNAISEFKERSHTNMSLIKNQPGFLGYSAYEHIDEQDNLIYVTMVTWEDAEAMKKAKEAVQAEYKKQGFDLAAMLERLHITLERGAYNQVTN